MQKINNITRKMLKSLNTFHDNNKRKGGYLWLKYEKHLS